MTKRTLHGVAYEDVGGPMGLPEDERITMIGNKAMLGQVVGVLVEDEGDKVDRYERKVIERFPGIERDYRGEYVKADGERPAIILLRFRRRPS